MVIGGVVIGGVVIGGLVIGGVVIGGLVIGGLVIGGLVIGGLVIGGLVDWSCKPKTTLQILNTYIVAATANAAMEMMRPNIKIL